MVVVNAPNTKDFTFTFYTKKPNKKHTLSVPIQLPWSPLHVNEFAERLIGVHRLPCFVEDDLKAQLKKFVEEESDRIKDEAADTALKAMKEGRVGGEPKSGGSGGVVALAEAWTKAYTREWRQYAKAEEPTDSLLFSEVYRTVIHSAAMETLLHIEHSYALEMEDLVRRRDEDLEILEAKQEEEMASAVKGLGSTHEDGQINAIAARHFEHVQMTESKWASEISAFRESQRREFRSWVIQMHEDIQTKKDLPLYLEKIKGLFDAKASTPPTSPATSSQSTPLFAGLRKSKNKESVESDSLPLQPIMEESFTIHLGTQMKTSFNLRLLCCDVIDHLCAHRPMTVEGKLMPSPQRLQTAMGLYSNSLTGLVLLVDCRLNSFTGIKRRFGRVCESSTDFHFDDLTKQFERIRGELDAVNKSRLDDDKDQSGDLTSKEDSASTEFLNVAEVVERETTVLKPGDFYVTRHSNLAQAHTVFHLAMNDTARDGNMTSRHFAILSIRNILKLCSQYDITTICIPLLLTHEMGEEMTIPWCIKRAELVFKCVKGFMMEMATWNGTGSSSASSTGASGSPGERNREIQFVVPPGIDDSLFQTFCNMLPGIFRLSNPLVVKSSS